MTVPIEVLLTEQELADEFLAALEKRYLDEKFFYWFPLSVKAWLDLCLGPQPYKNFARSYELVSRSAAEIARANNGAEVEVVSLGAGQGDKDLLLLQALAAGRTRVAYRPVDTSQSLLELAAHRAAEAGFAVRGLKADLGAARTGDALAGTAERPRLYLVLGNSLGVIDPIGFLATLRGWLRPGDRLLVDGEIFHHRETMAGYDNPVNRRFAFAPLASLGLEEGRDGALVFTSEADSRCEGLHRVAKHFRAARSLAVLVAGRQVELQGGETLAMNSSYKYERTTFLALVREAGFQPLAEYRSEDERFLLVLAAPGTK